ncbi:MAG: hypothetical protein M0Z75_17230, partial [Nitrospiraceae bacterium]|nr:hypothetical protein [Nitrospiraceae bacterium]
DVIDELRDKGIKAGLLKPRLFRPFPYAEIGQALRHLKAVCVMDRADSFGGYGPMFMEISSALYQADGEGRRPKLINKIYGLGGRDYMPGDARKVLLELNEISKGAPLGAVKEYMGVRE